MAEGIERIPVPVNHYGVVHPHEEMLECLKDDCAFRGDSLTCTANRHHLHSTEPSYRAAGEIAKEFRKLSVLTIWMHTCRHDEHHNNHEIDVRVPELDVMRQCIEDARHIQSLVINRSRLEILDNQLSRSDLEEQRISELRRKKDELIIENKSNVQKVMEIEVIPEELVTGALLLVAPNHARSKILTGSSYALTGTIPKPEISVALDTGNRFTEMSRLYWEDLALQTEVGGVLLVA